MRVTALASALLFVLSFTRAGDPQDAAPPQAKPAERYEYRRDHDPNGTGKFYMGREIAQVSGGPGWLDRPEREAEEHVSKVLPPLKIKPGDHVADVGAGTGHYSVKIAGLVGEQGKVYAVDIAPEMLAIIRGKVKKQNIKNVETILCTNKDPKLPAGVIDMIFMVDVYHELEYPFEVMEKMVAALKPGGRLVFLEYRLEDDKVPIKLVHKMSEKQVLREMAPFPVRHVETQGHLPWQHVIIFEKKK
jgi:precorrin-6B methylase 2